MPYKRSSRIARHFPSPKIWPFAAKTEFSTPTPVYVNNRVLKSLISLRYGKVYNLGVRCRLAQIVLLDTAWLLGGQPPIHAQETPVRMQLGKRQGIGLDGESSRCWLRGTSAN